MRYDFTIPALAPAPAPAAPPAPTPATVRPDFELPAPVACPCGSGEQGVPAVYFTGDSWTWGYDADCCCGPTRFWWGDEEDELAGTPWDWPFVDDFASTRDWEALGVKVV